jgi:hypothetical protein
MTATADRIGPTRSREELRLVELASGLLLLLDAYRLTGRLPLEVRVQASRLRHAVKLAVQAEATRTATRPPALPTTLAGRDQAAVLRAWIAAQPWVQPGPVGWVYLLCFRDPATGAHRPLEGNGCRGQYAGHYWGRAASSGLLKAVWQVSGGEFAELAWVDRVGPPGAPGTPPAPRHRLWVVGDGVPATVVGTAVVLGTVAAGAVVVGTPIGAVVVGAGPDGGVVDVAGARVAGGADLSAPATTTPTEVLPPCRDRLPNKLASGWLATVSTPVIATTAIPKASTAATATRCQRIGWGSASLAPSSLTSAWSPTRRTSVRRATLWADASEWVYTASAGATSRLTSAAPMRVPSTPKKDATTAPLTAASAPASNLGTRSCSISQSHLEVRLGTAALPCGGHGRSRIRDPAAAWRAPTLATQAGSRQVSPSQEATAQPGGAAAWATGPSKLPWSGGPSSRPLRGRGDPRSRTTMRTSALLEFTNPNGPALFLTVVRRSCSSTRNLAAPCEPVAHAG